MKTKLYLSLLLMVVVVAIVFAILWFLKKDKPLESEIYNTSGIALNGYDMVDLVDLSTIKKGKREIMFSHKEVEWLFSSHENLERFRNNPERYIPQYGGYCTYGMSKGYKATTQIETWTLVDGKLFMNYNLDIKQDWLLNQKEFIQKADRNWSTIHHKN